MVVVTSITSDWFTESNYYTGPQLTDDMISQAERSLGYKLPSSYVQLLKVKNGGVPRLTCYPTSVPTGWADDHVQIDIILGLGGKIGIDTQLGSHYMIAEWGYPNVGIMIGMTPSAGHEAIMLDYSLCGQQGEPRVIYVDVETGDGEPNVVLLASNFEEFLQGFVSCDNYPIYNKSQSEQ